MHKMLREILTGVSNDIKQRKNRQIKTESAPFNRLPFRKTVLSPQSGDIGLIAEIKLASPATGNLGKNVNILSRLKAYQNAGADAVSVITEKKFFQGNLNLVSAAKRNAANLPVLQKDFVIDEFQIYESQSLGADALLLIARIVDGKKLKEFVSLCQKLKLEPIVEICSEDDLTKATKSGTKIIAVNARNLETFKVDVDKACQLLKKIPAGFIKLGFSGIYSRKEVEKYKNAGVKAILVGTALMKTDAVQKLINELKMPVKVKICGIRNIECAKASVAAGADFLGFNFVPTSKRYIDPKMAAKIIKPLKGKIKMVGVFQNAPLDQVNKLVKLLRLDLVQLHGEEDNDYISKLLVPVIKSITAEEDPTGNAADHLLVDRPVQGQGDMVNFKKAAQLPRSHRIFLAGGLNPQNVAVAIRQTKPFAVDVAGGIETGNQQDITKINLFIKNAKGVFL